MSMGNRANAANATGLHFFHVSYVSYVSSWLRPKVFAPRSGQLGPSGFHGFTCFAPESPRCLVPRHVMDIRI